MAKSVCGPLAGVILLVAPVALDAQTAAPPAQSTDVAAKAPPPPSQATSYSTDCALKRAAYSGPIPLRGIRKALRAQRTVRVLAIGSSSTTGIGSSTPYNTYPVRLESDLEAYFKNANISVIARGVNGEVARAAADRMKSEVADVRPDLVLWQVGTNDAMARIDPAEVASVLRSTLKWLGENRVDVVLIDPQFTDRLADDPVYAKMVELIDQVAREEKVLLVRRFEAMKDLAKQRKSLAYLSDDRFHLNDLGYRCMAEYVSRAIIAGVALAEQEPPATR